MRNKEGMEQVRNKIEHTLRLLWLLFCAVFVLYGTEQVEAATSAEAESDGYVWTSYFDDGAHHMLNMPITDWKCSALPNGSWEDATAGTDYFTQQWIGDTGMEMTWNWTNVKKLSLKYDNVWNTKRTVNGEKYDAHSAFIGPTVGNGGSSVPVLAFNRLEGTFYIDPAYDMTGMDFSILPVSEQSKSYINVDAYFFIYPKCIQNKLSNSSSSEYYFMNYMVYWTGTQMIWETSDTFHGVSGIPLTYFDSEDAPDPFATADWYAETRDANATSTVAYGYNQVKNRSDYDGNWCFTIIHGGNGGGFLYRYLVGAEFDPNQILYDGNGATSGESKIQRQNYGQTVTILSNWFTKDGYVFNGWNTQADGSGKTYKAGDSYSGVKPLKLFAQWKQAEYTVTLKPNGGSVATSSFKTTYGTGNNYELTWNVPTRTGYTFTGWYMTATGGTQVYGADSYCTNEGKYWKNNKSVYLGNYTLYAHWEAITYTVRFHANGGVGAMSDVALTYDQAHDLPLNTFSKNNGWGDSRFLGWNVTPYTQEVLYKDGVEVKNLTSQDVSVVTLYAIWDDCPWITVGDLFYTLEQAQNGFITQEELMSHAVAEDREDGSPIPPGDDEATGISFNVIDYTPTDFTQFQKEGSVTETYQVVDSAGNSYKKTITVYIVDTTPDAVEPVGTIRFIDEKYYNEAFENGGLEANSVWITDSEYVAVIQKAFENAANDTPVQRYTFSHEEILEMKEYVKMHGVGNSKEGDALQKFYNIFMEANEEE